MSDELQAPEMLDVIEKGKAMAMISHASAFVGFPLFILPFLVDENEFSIIHAKFAIANFILTLVLLFVGMVIMLLSCGILFPAAFLPMFCYIPAIQGMLAANNGTTEEPLISGAIARMMFGPDFDKLS